MKAASKPLPVLLFFLVFPAWASAQPSDAHPRIWLSPSVISSWQGMVTDSDSPVGRAIAKCEDAHDHPNEYADGQYQGFAWVEALGGCLVAYQATGSAAHRDTALVYLSALLDDRTTVGDGLGPSFRDGVGIVSQDTGYSMRTHGVWAALGYDWLYDSLTQARRDSAHARFVQWLAFHDEPDTYMRAQPGANYHAGHVLAVTLIAIGHGHEMNGYEAGSGTALYQYVTNEMWGEVMADGYGPRGTLRGGDWLEGFQYAPLSLVSYSLAGRALVEQGVAIDWLDDFEADVLARSVHALSPVDRSFVGGDTEDDSPLIAPSSLPLIGVIAGIASPATKAAAQAELSRLAPEEGDDFRLLFEALAAAEDITPAPIDRATSPRGYLAAGTGNFYARTRFDEAATWIVSQCRGIVVDHQHANAGNVVLSRGGDDLLVDPGPYGSLSTLTGNAPTMSQPHFNEEYRPSQGAFGEVWGGDLVPANAATRFLFARATPSSVFATRCDYTGQLRFRDEPSAIVSSAYRDVVLLPGASGASMLIVDRALTTPAYAQHANPLMLRFHSLSAFETDRGGARAVTVVGASKLVVRRIFGAADVTTASDHEGSCGSGDRGKCADARFPAFRASVEIDGPNPMAMHLLDADASSATVFAASVTETGSTLVASIDRDSRRFHVVSARDGSPVASYRAPAVPSTHVVLDAPTGDRVAVVASKVGDACEVTLAASNDGFESKPLVFSIDAACVASADSTTPPSRPEGVGGVPDTEIEGGSGGGRCDVGAHEPMRTAWLACAVGLVGLVALRRVRPKRSR